MSLSRPRRSPGRGGVHAGRLRLGLAHRAQLRPGPRAGEHVAVHDRAQPGDRRDRGDAPRGRSTRTRRSGRPTSRPTPPTSSPPPTTPPGSPLRMAELPDAQREALSLAYFEGLSHSRDRRAAPTFPSEPSRDGSGWGSTASACSLPSTPSRRRPTDDATTDRDRLAGEALGALEARGVGRARPPRSSAIRRLRPSSTTTARPSPRSSRRSRAHSRATTCSRASSAEIEPEPAGRAAAEGPRRAGAGAARCPAFAVGAAAAAAAVFAVALALDAGGRRERLTPSPRSQGTPEFAGVRGEARLYGSARAGRRPRASSSPTSRRRPEG